MYGEVYFLGIATYCKLKYARYLNGVYWKNKLESHHGDTILNDIISPWSHA